jgi:hypothetical protein
MIYIGRQKSQDHLAHIMDVIKPERVAEQVERILSKIRPGMPLAEKPHE